MFFRGIEMQHLFFRFLQVLDVLTPAKLRC